MSRTVSDQAIATMVEQYRRAHEAIAEHEGHGCEMHAYAYGVAATLAAVLAALGITADDAEQIALVGSMTVVPIEPGADPDAPPLTDADISATDIDELTAALLTERDPQ